jgi:hypothetical protein
MTVHAQPNPREILVVREGGHRISWLRLDAALWQPDAIWPDPDQALMVDRHLERGGRVLVLLDPDLTIEDGAVRVPVLREELLTAPARVRVAVEDDDPTLTHLVVRMLDWLPAPLQAAGLAAIQRMRSARPGSSALLDGLVTDRTHDQVRYVQLSRPRTPSDQELDILARYTFPVTAAQAGGTTLGLRDLTRAGGRIDLNRGQRVFAA